MTPAPTGACQERRASYDVLDTLARADRLYAVLDAAGRPSILAYARHLLGRPAAAEELQRVRAQRETAADMPDGEEPWALAFPPGLHEPTADGDSTGEAHDGAALSEPGRPEPGRVAALWTGEPDGPHAALCPYLVRVDGALLTWVAEVLSPDPWGVFVIAPHHDGDPGGQTARVARALRRLLRVRTPDGSAVYFRFYDPRVLPDVLRVSTDAELRTLIGGGAGAFQAFAVTDPGGLNVTVFDRRAAPAPLPRVFTFARPAAPAMPPHEPARAFTIFGSADH